MRWERLRSGRKPTTEMRLSNPTCPAENGLSNAQRTIRGGIALRAAATGVRRRLYRRANGEMYSLCLSGAGRHSPCEIGSFPHTLSLLFL